MAYEINPNALKITLVAGADLSSAQFKFVKLNASGQAILCAAATDKPIGVLQNAPTSGQEASGQEAEVTVIGGTKVVLGGSVAEGAAVGTSSAGAGVALAFGTDTTKFVVGQALTEGSSAEIITVVVNCASAGRAA